MNAQGRTIFVLVPYAAAIWVTFYAYMDRNHLAGLIGILLVGAGLLVAIESKWLRSSLSSMSTLGANCFILTVLGLATGVPVDEIVWGTVFGALAGLVSSLACLWLCGMPPFRPRKTVFLSYRRYDSAYPTGRLRDRLAGRFGPSRIFMDVESLLPGVDFKSELQNFLYECDAVIAVIGRDWLDVRDDAGNQRLQLPSDYVRMEIASAILAHTPLIPLLVEHAEIPAAEELPLDIRKLADLQAVTVRPDPDFDRDVDELIATIERATNKSKSAASPVRSASPIKGIVIRGVIAGLLFAPVGWRILDELTRGTRDLIFAELSPDGRTLASVHGNRSVLHDKGSLRLWDLAAGSTTAKQPSYSGFGGTVYWSADGGYLAESGGISLSVIEGQTLRSVKTLTTNRGASGAWSMDGRRIITVDDSNRVITWNFETSEIIASSEIIPSALRYPLEVSPSGRRVAAKDVDNRLLVFEVDGANWRPVQIDHATNVEAVSWSKDERRLAIGRSEVPTLFVYEFDEGVTSVKQLTLNADRRVEAVAWSPDSARLASAQGGSVIIWNVEAGKQQHFLEARGIQHVAAVAWSPNGTRVATSCERVYWCDEVAVWDAETGSHLLDLERDDLIGLSGWSRDGTKLIIGYKLEIVVWNIERNAIEKRLRVGVLESFHTDYLLDRFVTVFPRLH